MSLAVLCACASLRTPSSNPLFLPHNPTLTVSAPEHLHPRVGITYHHSSAPYPEPKIGMLRDAAKPPHAAMQTQRRHDNSANQRNENASPICQPTNPRHLTKNPPHFQTYLPRKVSDAPITRNNVCKEYMSGIHFRHEKTHKCRLGRATITMRFRYTLKVSISTSFTRRGGVVH
jgi:hypothetical protein